MPVMIDSIPKVKRYIAFSIKVRMTYPNLSPDDMSVLHEQVWEYFLSIVKAPPADVKANILKN